MSINAERVGNDVGASQGIAFRHQEARAEDCAVLPENADQEWSLWVAQGWWSQLAVKPGGAQPFCPRLGGPWFVHTQLIFSWRLLSSFPLVEKRP
jgi:hypothetical protein